MKLTVAAIAAIALCLSTAPAMASAMGSAATSTAAHKSAHHRHHKPKKAFEGAVATAAGLDAAI